MAHDRAYRIHVQFDPKSEGYAARVPELGLLVDGSSRAEALESAELEIETEIERRVTAGEDLPPPVEATDEPMQLELQLSGLLSRELRFHAGQQKIGVEALATQLIALGLGALEGGGQSEERAPRADDDRRQNQRRGRRREGYRPDMDNQANFLAYVREMEKGGRRGGNR